MKMLRAGVRTPVDGASRTLRAYRHPVLLGGAAAGTLDILAAFALQATNGVQPIRVLQAIASGAIGASAFAGGAAAAALGLALHLVIAFSAALVYFAASRGWPILARRPLACGAAYGVVVYAVMSQVVLPLSRVGFGPPPWPIAAWTVLIHMLFIGLPIALAVAASGGRTDASAG